MMMVCFSLKKSLCVFFLDFVYFWSKHSKMSLLYYLLPVTQLGPSENIHTPPTEGFCFAPPPPSTQEIPV